VTELTKRQQDILKVPPIVWESVFGGFLYSIRVATENIEKNPAGCKEVLDNLSKDLQNIRVLLVKGDVETNPPEKDPS
jgi:hypothetical protein